MPIEFTDLSPKKQPLTNFTRCHLGIVSQLELSARLPELVDAANRARKTALDTLELFRSVVLPHHAEEENELFPAVIAACNAAERERVQPIVDRLTGEHRVVEALWKQIEPSIRAAGKGTSREVDAEMMEEIVRKVLRHARYEEVVFLPLAERILSRNGDHMAALGLALHLRHAPLVVGHL